MDQTDGGGFGGIGIKWTPLQAGYGVASFLYLNSAVFVTCKVVTCECACTHLRLFVLSLSLSLFLPGHHLRQVGPAREDALEAARRVQLPGAVHPRRAQREGAA